MCDRHTKSSAFLCGVAHGNSRGHTHPLSFVCVVLAKVQNTLATFLVLLKKTRFVYEPRSIIMSNNDSLLTDEQLKAIHKAFPYPVGKGNPSGLLGTTGPPNPMMLATHMAVSGRINRGAIPFPLEDLRCSYCLTCHGTAPLRCARCKKVYYCNRSCQKKHWTFHKQVCGTVTETWDVEG